jgi:hypothetical protein
LNVRVRLGTGNTATTSESLGDVVRLGRNPDCEIAVDPLAFPMVSGLHARIEAAGPGFVLVHLSQSNRTLVNGSDIEGSVPVRAGDRVRLGITVPIVEILAIESTGHAALADAPGHGNTVEADFRQMAMLRGTAGARRFEIGAGGVIGRDVRAVQYHLDHAHVSRLHINLVVRPREFVCILGPSGSGKSTLLAILSGRNLPDAGMVFLNGADLNSNFEALKEDIAVVRQKDALARSEEVRSTLARIWSEILQINWPERPAFPMLE